MFEHPYFLAIGLLAVVFLFYRQRKYFLTHANVKVLQSTQVNAGSGSWRSWMQFVLFGLGWVFLVLAASGLTWGFIKPIKRQQVHKYVLVNDGSGSMVDFQKPKGRGIALDTVHKGNQALLKMLSVREDGSKDMVGAVVFSNDAFVVSYLVDDPSFIEKKLDYVDYKNRPLAQGTDLEKALWCGMDLLLRDGKVSEEDSYVLQKAMYGQGQQYIRNHQIDELTKKCSKAADGNSIVIFTDGLFDPNGNVGMMSTFKLLDLCKELHIRAYVISVEVIEPLVMMGLNNSGGGGVVIRNYNDDLFAKAYENIVKSQSQEEIIVDTPIRKSLSPYLASIALGMLGAGLFLNSTLNRNFTEV